MDRKIIKKYQTVSCDKTVKGELQLVDGLYVFLISCEGKDFCFDMFPEKSLPALGIEWWAERLFDAQAPKAALGELWQEKKKPDVRLFHWYLYKKEREKGPKWYASGIVLGHPKLYDSSWMSHSSSIVKIEVDESLEEVRIETRNTVFHAPLNECDYTQESSYEYFPELKKYREIYEPKQRQYDVEDNTVLLVFSDHARYYFQYGAMKQDGTLIDLSMAEHIGTFQDSCLVNLEGEHLGGDLDIRYFPHPGNIQFYMLRFPDKVKLYVEYRGDRDFYIDYSDDTWIHLRTGERKVYDSSSTSPKSEGPPLMGGDLYPAGIIL